MSDLIEFEVKIRELINKDPNFVDLIKDSFIANLVGDDERIRNTSSKLHLIMNDFINEKI